MLTRMPACADPEEIKTELIAAGYPVHTVKQLTKFENNQTTKLPLFILELENSEKGREIYELKRLLYMVVSVKAYKPRSGMKQCYRCQRFNHTFPGCSLTPRCLLCCDKHQHEDCPNKVAAKNDKQLLKYANCGEAGQPTSFKGCKSYVAALAEFNKPKSNIRTNSNNKKQTTLGRTFNSRKVTASLSFGSAVAGNKPLTEPPKATNPAQSRLAAAVIQSQNVQSESLTNLQQLVENLTPVINGLNSPMDRFMLLSKLVENCIGHNV